MSVRPSWFPGWDTVRTGSFWNNIFSICGEECKCWTHQISASYLYLNIMVKSIIMISLWCCVSALWSWGLFVTLFQTVVLCYSVTAVSESQVHTDTKVLELFKHNFFFFLQTYANYYLVYKENNLTWYMDKIAKLILHFGNCLMQKLNHTFKWWHCVKTPHKAQKSSRSQ